jgi:GDPmannose 4,6-dehydratase|tara:strand:- start:388 stop:1380 length:993 start_codon:yes stop_codon:yes gene_type:complete
MKAIIFGITGQDGSHLADLLLEKDYKVVGVCRRASTDNTGRIKHILNHPSFSVFQGDITDAHSVIKVLKEHADVDEIYNLAAQSHVAVSFKQPGLTWDITGKGCLNILQSIEDLEMRNVRFYQASSSEMYGKNYDTDRDQNKFQNEDTKFLPQSPYAIAKCAAHHMTRLFREGYGTHASAGILFNHEGPRRGETFVTRKITKWIGEFVKSGRDPEFTKLRLGNLEAFRDWGYAGDYVEAMWAMLQQDQPDDYVICTGETHTIHEFLDVAFKHIGVEDWSGYVVQDPEFYRPAEVDYLRGCNNKALEILGWEPRNSFYDLVKMMVDHDVEN